MPIAESPAQTIPLTRSLRRSRGRWRILAFVALALAVLIGLARFWPELAGPSGQTIARVAVSGLITTNRERTELLGRLADDDNVAAVIVSISSGGGTSAGGEELYQSIRRIAEQKPVVSTIAETGASAAYMAAVGSDRIFARNLSIVGSIGVYYQHIDASDLLETIGIDLEKITSGPLKGRPDFDGPITPEVRQSLEDLVESSFDYFRDLVVERRDLTPAQTLALTDGRVLSGADGIAAGLIDAAGGEAEARAWLAAEHGIDPETPAVEVWPRRQGPGLIDLLLGRALDAVFGPGLDQGLPLDGLVSLWHLSER